jgi:hypothetical protein
MFFGFLLVGLGILFLLKNLGIITGPTWGIIWPCAVIAIGLSAVFKKNKKIWE